MFDRMQSALCCFNESKTKFYAVQKVIGYATIYEMNLDFSSKRFYSVSIPTVPQHITIADDDMHILCEDHTGERYHYVWNILRKDIELTFIATLPLTIPTKFSQSSPILIFTHCKQRNMLLLMDSNEVWLYSLLLNKTNGFRTN